MTMIICVIAAPSHLVAFLFIRETTSSIRVAVMATSRIFHAKSSLCNKLLLILQIKIEAQTKQKQSENYRDCEEAAKHASVSSHHHRSSTESHLCQARLILEFQDLCDHSNLSLVHLQTLTTELKLLHRENADLKVANSELVKLVSLAFQAFVMQHQQCTLGNNRAVAFERRNSANNVGTESSSGAKMLSPRGEMDCSRKLVSSPFFVTCKSPSSSFQVAASCMNSLALTET